MPSVGLIRARPDSQASWRPESGKSAGPGRELSQRSLPEGFATSMSCGDLGVI
jgi:hypothetical protein